eukprot:CAMPEP_0185172668 /NCGR_PEP_ID=MMETSP1139-20130426/21918_1 /TAXON_ID=298111 /ORGANISM="Pavlova sp., Strain CCMP459" /LENGTH=123 /DNA_ID=CAMNT_0027738321 /DNA_START=158 /DNA_END=526 /DNA_ORIENTATION=+
MDSDAASPPSLLAYTTGEEKVLLHIPQRGLSPSTLSFDCHAPPCRCALSRDPWEVVEMRGHCGPHLAAQHRGYTDSAWPKLELARRACKCKCFCAVAEMEHASNACPASLQGTVGSVVPALVE